MGDRPKPPSKLAGGKFEVEKKLGAGCFGEVWRGKVAEDKTTCAIKFEDVQGHALQLEHEAEVLKSLSKPNRPQGVAECLYFGREGRYHCMVMELLGKSLEERVQNEKGTKFTARTASLVGEQVLYRIEYLHSKGIVHRDIKPENFMFGIESKIHHLYLIDFGLSKKYWDTKHVQIRTKLSLTGTARYASINAHRGIEQSRRDDLEAIGHMLIYFLRGSLPWSGLEAKTQEEKYRKIREKKEEVPIQSLITEVKDGKGKNFAEYLSICRNLDFKERPDYDAYRKMFKQVYDDAQEWHFQWLEKKAEHEKNTTGKDWFKEQKLVPLDTNIKLSQPDDVKPRSKGFCFCGGSKTKS